MFELGTVQGVIRRLFPKGTSDHPAASTWDQLPTNPVDTFAAVATLIRMSGCYQYMGDGSGQTDPDPFGLSGPVNQAELRAMAAAYAFGLEFDSPSRQVDAERQARDAFALEPSFSIDAERVKLQAMWTELLSCLASPYDVKERGDQDSQYPTWWKTAMRLLVIADEASTGVGFNPRRGRVTTFAQASARTRAFVNYTEDTTVSIVPTVASDLVDRELAIVMPKTRTPEIGCTLRSLTHNLALLPPAGQVRTRWFFNRSMPLDSAESQCPLNLLLVPFPYEINASCFPSLPSDDPDHNAFEIEQRWVKDTSKWRNALWRFVQDLIEAADREGVHVHGVVFPEGALSWEAFHDLSRHLATECYEDFEFLIAGLSGRPTDDSTKPEIERGNFVAIRGLLKWEDQLRRDGRCPMDANHDVAWDYQAVRAKHHRWKLERNQLERYAISHRLPAQKSWWEGIGIGPRDIDIVEPRSGTTLTTLICEDLARIDPCQDVLRAIGPNLVIAILMDGPQLATRWPAHYAGVLADDPGSSVLTLTSYGLIARSAPSLSASRSVAFWRNSLGQQKELSLPSNADALVVSLKIVEETEVTMDGRSDGGVTLVWNLADVMPVAAPKGRAELSEN